VIASFGPGAAAPVPLAGMVWPPIHPLVAKLPQIGGAQLNHAWAFPTEVEAGGYVAMIKEHFPAVTTLLFITKLPVRVD